MKSKTIIISSQNENEKGRGILTLYHEDDLLKCRLRLYNVEKLNRFCKLGVYHQNEVFSANLLEKNGTYTSSMVGDFDIDKDFYTAIIDTSNNNNVILSGGTYAGFFFNDQSVFEKENTADNEHIFENVEKENPNTNLFNYEEDEMLDNLGNSNAESNEITLNSSENDIQCEQVIENDTERCKNCKYKEYFYSCQKTNQSNSDQTSEDSSTTLCSAQNDKEQRLENKVCELKELRASEQQQTSILNSLIPQFQYVFDNYQADDMLNSLIPNSKFVKINENQEQYSIGAIYEDEKMKYICYAVLKNYNSPAPQELGPHYQWLPLDKEDPLSEGYFIVFQDAEDLKIVEL